MSAISCINYFNHNFYYEYKHVGEGGEIHKLNISQKNFIDKMCGKYAPETTSTSLFHFVKYLEILPMHSSDPPSPLYKGGGGFDFFKIDGNGGGRSEIFC